MHLPCQGSGACFWMTQLQKLYQGTDFRTAGFACAANENKTLEFIWGFIPWMEATLTKAKEKTGEIFLFVYCVCDMCVYVWWNIHFPFLVWYLKVVDVPC